MYRIIALDISAETFRSKTENARNVHRGNSAAAVRFTAGTLNAVNSRSALRIFYSEKKYVNEPHRLGRFFLSGNISEPHKKVNQISIELFIAK